MKQLSKELEESLKRFLESPTREQPKPRLQKKRELSEAEKKYRQLVTAARLESIFHLYANEIRLDINSRQPNDDGILAMAKSIEEQCRNVPLRAMASFFREVRLWKHDKGGFGVPAVSDYEYCARLFSKGAIRLKVMEHLDTTLAVKNIPEEKSLANLRCVKVLNAFITNQKQLGCMV